MSDTQLPKEGFYVYLHCRPDGTPFYVGKGSHSGRGNRHLKFNQRNEYHTRIANKYGRKNIGVLVFEMADEKSAFACEIALIKLFRQLGFELANLTDGGEGYSNPSAESLARRSASRKLCTTRFITVHTPEAKLKIGEASLRLWSNPEHRAKMSAIGKARVFTDEHRARISAGKKGHKNV